MISAWLGALKGDERENMRAQVMQAQKVLDKLSELVYNMRNGQLNVVTSDYSTPSWSHEQAHRNGFVEACDKVLALAKFDNN